jgi:hypothetical protein
MKKMVCLAALLAAAPVRAAVDETIGWYGLVELGLFAGAVGSSGTWSSGSDRQDVPRLIGAAEIAGAVTLFVYQYSHGGNPHWLSESAFVALGAYNLLNRGGVEWRIVGNEIGLNAAMLGAFVDYRRDPRPAGFSSAAATFTARW